MRKLSVLLASCAALRCSAWAQQTPPSQDGTMASPAAALSSQDSPAMPDAEGVYRRGVGLMLPGLVEAVPVNFPAHAPPAEGPRNCVVSMIVGINGIATGIRVLRCFGPEADREIVEALAKEIFEPGTLNGTPVPMEIEVALRFFSDTGSAVPHVRWSSGTGAAQRTRKWDTAPVMLHSVEAEFTDKARRAGVQGVVVLSFVVDEKGRPTNIVVKRPLGMGLDENAVQALRQYEFKPAIKDGKPIAAELTMEVRFRLNER